jgi:hypothetical protein
MTARMMELLLNMDSKDNDNKVLLFNIDYNDSDNDDSVDQHRI